MAKFGYVASQSAKHSNRMFKAKRIKDDHMLTERQVNEVEQSTTAVLKHLDAMEVTWSNKQKQKKKQRLKENIQKKVRANDFVDQLQSVNNTEGLLHLSMK